MISNLKKETLIYGFGRVLGSSISFLLFPFYTHALQTTGEYGIVQIIIAFIAFANIIFLFGFDGALMKYYVSSNKMIQKKQYLSTTYISVLGIASILLFLLIFFRTELSLYLIAGQNSNIIIKIGFILFFDALRSIHLLILRAENRPYNFAALQIFDIMLLTGLNIYFVGFNNQGIDGVVQSNLISSITIFTISFLIIFNRFSFSLISFANFKTLKSFALPLMPAGLFWMILEFADRKMLEFWVNENPLHNVGIYGAGYKLGALMLLLVYAFNYAWRPYFLKENNMKSFKKVSTYVLFGLGFFYIILVLYIDKIATYTLPIVNTSLINAQYWEGLIIVPIIALSYIFHGSFILQEASPFLDNKVYKISICRAVGVLINIIFNIILIPYYELSFGMPYLGAAIATLIAYSAMSVLLYMWNYSNQSYRYSLNLILIITTNILLSWYLLGTSFWLIKILFPLLYILQFKYYVKCQRMILK